jgi:hypothetical protein
MGMYVFLSFIPVGEKWTVRSETSRENLKHRGKNGKVIPAHIIKACTGMEVQLHSTLMLARNGGEWSAPRLGRITTVERPSIVNEYEAK